MKPFSSHLFSWLLATCAFLSAQLHSQNTIPPALPTVGVKAARAETSEPSPLARIAPGEFIVYRDLAQEALNVSVSFEGSATPGGDYEALPKSVHFEAGQAEVSVLIAALDDSLAEQDETVVLTVTPPPTANLPAYNIDPSASSAKVIIHDNGRAEGASIKITFPEPGAALPAAKDVEVTAVAVDPNGYIATLEFYLDGALLDTSTITFIRAPDPGTPIYHSVLWKSPSPGKHELVARGKDARGVIISSEPVAVEVLGAGGTDGTLVSIRATDPEGTELPPTVTVIDALEFEISRTGPTNSALIVFFSLHGSASKSDYAEVPTSIIIPAGSASAALHIVPVADLTKMLEPMETVGVQLEPSPMMGPLPTYGIDPDNARAAGVIYELAPPQGGAVELAFPDVDQIFPAGPPIELLAASYTPEVTRRVEFYDGDILLNPVPRTLSVLTPKLPALNFQSFIWQDALPGKHLLSARVTLGDGTQVISRTVPVTVEGPASTGAEIRITEPADGQSFAAGQTINITAVAVDPAGYIPHLDFYANNVKIGESDVYFFRAPDPGTPVTHTFAWENVPAGTYLLTARGVSAAGETVISQPVKISAGGPDGTEAKLSITSPASGAVFDSGADIPVTAVAVDPNGYIARVDFYANDQLIGVSEIAFFRAPDPGTPITHTTVWENAPAGDYVLSARAVDSKGRTVVSEPVKITVGETGAAGNQVVVMVEAADPFAAETTDSGAPDSAVFVIRRIGGAKDVDVPIFFKLGGTAVNGEDYSPLKKEVVLPAGKDSVDVVIQPIPDKALEDEESVSLELMSPVCPLVFPPPPQCYLISKSSSARAVIRDRSSGADDLQPKVAILPPNSGSFASGVALEIRADAAAQGKTYVLETSLDLKTWNPVAPVVLPDGQLTYVTETGADSLRFYRLRVQ